MDTCQSQLCCRKVAEPTFQYISKHHLKFSLFGYSESLLKIGISSILQRK